MSLPFSTEEYYEKVIQLQDKLRQSEEERLKLEMKYNEVIQVMKEEEEHHFKKLRAKYKQFLEEDRLRQQRNDKILDALERIENRSQIWKAKSDKFKELKKRYRYPMGPQTCLYDREETAIRPDIRNSAVDNYLKNNMTTIPNEVVQPPPESKYSNLGNVNSMYWKDSKDIEKNDEKICTERDFCYTPLKSTKNLENSLKQSKPPLLSYDYLELGDQLSHKTPLATTLEVHSSLRRLLKDDTPPTEKSLDYQPLQREIRPVPLISDTKTVLTTNKDNPQPSEISQVDQHKPLEIEIVKAPITIKPVFSNSDTTSVPENNNKAMHSRITPSVVSTSRTLHSSGVSEPTHTTSILENNSTMHSRITPSAVTTSSKPHSSGVYEPTYIQSPDMKKTEAVVEPFKEDVDIPPVVTESLGYDESQRNIDTSASSTVEHEVVKEKETTHQEGNEKEEQLSTVDSEPQESMMPQGKEVDDEVQSLHPQVEEKPVVEDHTDSRNDSEIEILKHDNEKPETSHQKENGQVLEQYNGNDQPLQYNENANEQIALQYDENGQPLHYDESIQQYDANGQPIQYYSGSATDPQYYDQTGQYAQYDEHGQLLQYDEQGQLLQQYDENGQPIHHYYNNGLQYDEHGQPILQYDENGQPIMQYDENGQPIMQYDENGQPIGLYDVNGQYDENGQLIGYSTDGQAFVDYNENSPQQLDENGLQQSQLQVEPNQGDYTPQEKNKEEDAQPQGGVETDSPPAVAN
ncbi:hypothetical protein PPYR_08949 [Photinus pyralis]|uniref:Uncharacterized protein n=3 Tax=Photinus pyralis TaxID=7054 RepID=A0A5N4AKX5_PHOPY|nr:uncharacterized protein LOC116171756 [Photinus pyralis]KAB0797956.1 hypothetical protein PPYR_08949 [Photinus pyralis]